MTKFKSIFDSVQRNDLLTFLQDAERRAEINEGGLFSGQIANAQPLSFPIQAPTAAQEGFQFTAPRFEGGSIFEQFPELFDESDFSFLRPQELLGEGDESDLEDNTKTPGDRPGNPDAPGGVFGDVAANVFGQAIAGVAASPLGVMSAFTQGVLDPSRPNFFVEDFFGTTTNRDIFDQLDIDAGIDSLEDGLAGAEGTIGEDEPDEGFGGQTGDFSQAPDEEQGTEAFGEGPGGESGEGADDRVICTELYRQGIIPRKLLAADLRYSRKHISPTTLLGYHFWAKPYVRLMKRSKLATKFIEPFGVLRAKECQWQLCQADKACWRGKVIRLVGEPLCYGIGLSVRICRSLLSARERLGLHPLKPEPRIEYPSRGTPEGLSTSR